MKIITKLLFLMMILATSVAFGVATDQDKKVTKPYTYKTPKLNRAQFDALLANPGQLQIIDVRRPDELAKIGGFLDYINIQLKDIEKNLAVIPKNKSIITVSNHAHRAGEAGDLLTAKGYKVVGAVGAQNYEEEGGKLAKIEIPTLEPSAETK